MSENVLCFEALKHPAYFVPHESKKTSDGVPNLHITLSTPLAPANTLESLKNHIRCDVKLAKALAASKNIRFNAVSLVTGNPVAVKPKEKVVLSERPF